MRNASLLVGGLEGAEGESCVSLLAQWKVGAVRSLESNQCSSGPHLYSQFIRAAICATAAPAPQLPSRWRSDCDIHGQCTCARQVGVR